MNEKTDSILVQETLRGDSSAFAVLVERHLTDVYRFAYRYMRDREEAEDVAQEAFIRAWKHLRRFDQARSFRTWLFAIAKNAALDMIKKKKPIPFSEINEEEEMLGAFLAPFVEGEELPDALFDRGVAKKDIERALKELPLRYRTVIAMRYQDNLKFREIAEALDEPIDTVKSKHRRGLALLKKIVSGTA